MSMRGYALCMLHVLMGCLSPYRTGVYALLAMLSLAGVTPVLAHPMPDVPVRASFDKEGDFEITVEVDPRSFEADPNTAPYLVEEKRLAMTEEQREALLTKVREFVNRTVALKFTTQEPMIPAFEYRFTTLEGAVLGKADDPVMVTGRWRGTLPKDVRDYSITALPEGQLSVLFLNTMLGKKVERFQVLFPGESSYKLSLRPVVASTRMLGVWSLAFRDALAAGFLHVCWRGIEHLLIVLGLCMLNGRRQDWVTQLKAYGVCQMLLIPVVLMPETLTIGLVSAASLLVIALLNFLTRPMPPWRVVLAGLAGVVHGMALARHFRGIEAVQDSMAAALLGYLIGVSGVQVMAVLLLSGLTQPLGHPVAFRKLVTVPVSMLISAAGLWLFLHRLYG